MTDQKEIHCEVCNRISLTTVPNFEEHAHACPACGSTDWHFVSAGCEEMVAHEEKGTYWRNDGTGFRS